MVMGSFADEYHAVEGSLSDFSTFDFKNFTIETPAYVAFTFTYGSGTQYGWANITWHNDLSLTINEWAYTTLGDNLTIGQTSGVPEPAETACGLGVLVLGAAFLRRRDKARKLA
jgi:MYXO-CTERM domain-containing protein